MNDRTKNKPDYAFFRDGLREVSKPGFLPARFFDRHVADIVAIVALPALSFLGYGLSKAANATTTLVVGVLVIAAMIGGIGLAALLLGNKRHATNCPQQGDKAAQSGDE